MLSFFEIHKMSVSLFDINIPLTIISNDMFCGHDLFKIYLLILTISVSIHYCDLSKHKSVKVKSVHLSTPKPSRHYIKNSKLRHPLLTRMKQFKEQERKYDTAILRSNLQVLNDRTKADLLKLRGSFLSNYIRPGKFPGTKYRNVKHSFRSRRDNEEYYKHIMNQIFENVDKINENKWNKD